MVSSQVGIGNWNSQLRLTLTQKSQNVGANTSSVECRVEVYNGGTAPAFSGSGVNWSLSGDVSKGTASGPLNVPAKSWRTVGTYTANVSHGSDGVKRATVKATLGNTPTATFGNGGSVTTSINLTRIPKAPAKCGKPTVNNVSSSGARGNLGSAPNDNGSEITRYEWLREGGSWVNGSTSRSYNFTGLAANSNYRVKVRARNSVGVGPESDWSNTFTTAPNAPAAVTNAKVVRVSDSAQDLSWTRNPTAAAPYSSIQVERRDTVNGSRVRVATLAGTATSYRDGATVAGRRYDYYVRPVNAGGDGAWSAGLGVNTTPPAPNDVNAVKDGTAIDVTWNRVATQWGVVNHVIQDNPGGTGWVTVATVGNVGSWTHVAPDTSKTHQYRVRTVVYLYNATDAGRLSSVDSKPSGLVQLLAAPLAPSLIAPVGTVDRDLPVVFSWKHNPVDTTKQSAFELRYRLAGNPWTETSGSTAQTLTIPALGVTGNVEWQVRTKGQFASFGSWSAVASFGLGGAPSVTINSPVSGTLPQSRVTVTWGYYQPDSVPQTSWRAVLTDGLTGTPIQTLTGSGTATTATFTRLLTDSTEYGLEVTVTAANGISATDSVAFVTDFPLPVTVEPVPNWDRETGSVSLTFTDTPTPALYAWTGTPDASTSTKTTAAGTVTNLETNPRFATTSGIPAGMTRTQQPDGTWHLINPPPATRGYGHSPYGHSEYGH